MEWRRLFNVSHWSITAKLSTALLVAALVPISIASVYNIRQAQRALANVEYKNLELLAVSTGNRLDQILLDTRRTVELLSKDRSVIEFLSASPTDRPTLKPSVDRILENIRLANPDFLELTYLLDASGTALASPNLPQMFQDQVNYQFRDYYRIPREQGKSYISSMLVGVHTKEPGIFFSAPVFDDRNTFIGVAVIKVKGRAIWDIIDSVDLQVSDSGAFLIDQDGVIIAHPDKNLLYHSLDRLDPEVYQRITTDRGDGSGRLYGTDRIISLNIPELADAMIGADEPSHIRYYFPLQDQYKIAGFAPMQNKPWTMAVIESEQQFLLPLHKLTMRNLAAMTVIGGVMALASLQLARSIVKPIHALAQGAEGLKQNNFNPRLLTHSEEILKELKRDRDVIAFLSTSSTQTRQELLPQIQRLLVNCLSSLDKSGNIYLLTKTGDCLAMASPSNQLPEKRLWQHSQMAVRQSQATVQKPRNSANTTLLIGSSQAQQGVFFSSPVRAIDRKVLGIIVVELTAQPDYAADLIGASRSQDDIGQLAKTFLQMSSEIKVREENLHNQVAALRTEIDQAKKERQVAETNQPSYFRDLQVRAKQIRSKVQKS